MNLGLLPCRVARIPSMALIWIGLTTVWATMLYAWGQAASLVLLAMGLLFMASNPVDASGWGVLVIVVAILNWVAYWCSHHVRLAYWARQITEDRDPYIFAVAFEQAKLAGLPMPRVIESPLFTASAIGRIPSLATLGVSPTLQCKLNRRELAAVLAHEMAHVKNRDSLVGTVAMTVAGIVLAVSILLNLPGWLGAIVLLLPAVSWLLESRADTTAADVCGDSIALARALQKLPHSSFLSSLLNLSFIYHPPTKLRVWRLEKLTNRNA